MFSKMTNKELIYYHGLLSDSDNIYNKELIKLYNDYYWNIYFEVLNFLPVECLEHMEKMLVEEMRKRIRSGLI